MKRVFLLLLAVLMLTACGTPPEEETTEKATLAATEPQPTEPVELWLPEESDTALTAYGPQWEHYSILPLADGALVFQVEEGQTRVRHLQGKNLTPMGELVLEDTRPEEWRADGKGNFARVSKEHKTVSVYNTRLVLTKNIVLPGEQVENACVSGDFSRVYYSTGADIMVYDTVQNLAIPLRVGGESLKKPLQLTGNDTLLFYEESVADQVEFCLVDAANGQTVQTIAKSDVWQASDVYYYMREQENCLQFANYNQKKWELTLGEEARIADLAPKAHKALGLEGNILSVYDLQSGKMTAQVTLPEGAAVTTAVFTPEGNRVWICAGNRLYLWDTALSPVEDRTVYTKQVR